MPVLSWYPFFLQAYWRFTENIGHGPLSCLILEPFWFPCCLLNTTLCLGCAESKEVWRDLFGQRCCCVDFASFHCYSRCLANVQSRGVFFTLVGMVLSMIAQTWPLTATGTSPLMIAQILVRSVHGQLSGFRILMVLLRIIIPPPHRSAVAFIVGRSRKWIQDLCKRNETMWPRVPTSMRSSANNNHILLWPTSTSSTFSGLCSKDLNLVPAMARHSCMAGAWGPILYQICLQAAWLPNICNPTFLVCSYLTSDHLEVQDFLVLSYIFIPGAGLFLTFVIHIFAFFFGNVRTMQVPENAQLRRAVHRRTMQLQERLQNGQLDTSLWWSRRMLESKLFFFAADIVLDAICCVNFFLAESYEFAACQLVIIIFSAVLQFRTTDIRTTWKAVQSSWQTGLANNALHVILLQEKTCEAPLSLFFQFFAAFYLNEEWWTFVSLWLSILFSILGIANGLYIRNHLTPFDLETLEEEEVCRPKTPPATVGLPSWPSDQTMQGIQGMQGPSCLPPPPGLPALPKEGRKPGQYASATEWIWTTMTSFLAQFIDPYAPAGMKLAWGSRHVSLPSPICKVMEQKGPQGWCFTAQRIKAHQDPWIFLSIGVHP